MRCIYTNACKKQVQTEIEGSSLAGDAGHVKCPLKRNYIQSVANFQYRRKKKFTCFCPTLAAKFYSTVVPDLVWLLRTPPAYKKVTLENQQQRIKTTIAAARNVRPTYMKRVPQLPPYYTASCSHPRTPRLSPCRIRVITAVWES